MANMCAGSLRANQQLTLFGGDSWRLRRSRSGKGRWEHTMGFSLRSIDGVLRFGRILAALTLLGVSWQAAVPVRAADGPAARRSASTGERVADEPAPAGTIYTVSYPVADILSEIQSKRNLGAAVAKDYLRDRVQGPPVMQWDATRLLRPRVDAPQWLENDLIVVANQPGHEQVAAMLAAFRKFGVIEYAISVRFITMPVELTRKAFPDSTSSLLAMYPNSTSNSEAVSPEVLEPPLGDRDGAAMAKARTVIEEDEPMRFRVLDEDAMAKLIKAAESDRRSNVLQAPRVTAISGQTASVSDLSHSKFVVGAIPLPSGGRELKTRDVTEGTSLQLRPKGEASGDIRLNMAASFSKIEKVTKENLTIAPGDEVALQIPRVATLRIDGGFVLKPGQSLMFGSVKRLSEGRSVSWTDKLLGRSPKREEQDLIVILRVDPFELPGHGAGQVSAVAERN
jgi:hypothetical protein